MRQRTSMLELARRVLAEVEAAKPLPPEMETTADGHDLASWISDHCVFRDRCWGAIGALHVDFAQWRADHWQPVPISRRVFEAALIAEERYIEEGFCYGLILKDDLWALNLPNDFDEIWKPH